MADITIPIETHLTNDPVELGSFVSQIVGLALSIAAIVAFVFLVWGGIEWIVAGGDKGKIESARNRITGAIVGLAIVALSWAIYLLLDNFFGIGVAGRQSGSSSNNSTNTTITTNSGQGTCLYPTRRCCDNVADTSCFCQNPNYRTATYGSCNAGGGQTGILCGCVPR